MDHHDYLLKVNDEIDVFIEEYKECKVTYLYDEFQINDGAKNRLSALVKKMLLYSKTNLESKVGDGSNLFIKTIKLDKYGRLKESMSFPVFKYLDIAKEDWMSSSLRKTFADNTFVFTVFKNVDKELYLKSMRLWKMPEQVLDSGVRVAWEQMKNCVTSGKIVKYIDDNGRYVTYFPSSTENQYVHVRPHALNRNDTFPLPVPDKLTGLTEYPKHSFWLNRSYVQKIINEGE